MNTDINTRRQQDAVARADNLAAFIRPLRAEGKSLREIAAALTTAGIPTANGGAWGPKQAQRLALRLDRAHASPAHPRDPLSELVVPAQSVLPEGADPLATLPFDLPTLV